MSTFSGAIASARHIFDLAEMMGFHMELLDIGGGFTGHFDDHGSVMFGETADAINSALETEFPPDTGKDFGVSKFDAWFSWSTSERALIHVLMQRGCNLKASSSLIVF